MKAFTLFAQVAPEVGDGAGLLGGAIAVMAVIWIVGIAATIFWLWMLVDALTNEPTTEQKLLWFLVIFFLPFLGALIYLFARKGNRAPST
jgi:hypothetical protein